MTAGTDAGLRGAAAAERRRLARRSRWRRYRVAYAFLAPALVLWALFLLVPVVSVGGLTFFEGGFLQERTFVGLRNWAGVLGDTVARSALTNTIAYTVAAIALVFLVGGGLALLLARAARGGALLRTLLYLPVLAPMVVASLIWLFVLHPDFGIVALALQAVGVTPVNWLGDHALAAIVLLEVWRGTGFYAVLFLAGLLSLPKELYQAAALDGAGRWRRFVHLTLPLMRPTLLFALVFGTISNLQIFDSVYVLTGGGPGTDTATIAWYIQQSIFTFNKPGYGATLSFLLLVVTLVLSLAQFRLLRDRRRRRMR